MESQPECAISLRGDPLEIEVCERNVLSKFRVHSRSGRSDDQVRQETDGPKCAIILRGRPLDFKVCEMYVHSGFGVFCNILKIRGVSSD